MKESHAQEQRGLALSSSDFPATRAPVLIFLPLCFVSPFLPLSLHVSKWNTGIVGPKVGNSSEGHTESHLFPNRGEVSVAESPPASRLALDMKIATEAEKVLKNKEQLFSLV